MFRYLHHFWFFPFTHAGERILKAKGRKLQTGSACVNAVGGRGHCSTKLSWLKRAVSAAFFASISTPPPPPPSTPGACRSLLPAPGLRSCVRARAHAHAVFVRRACGRVCASAHHHAAPPVQPVHALRRGRAGGRAVGAGDGGEAEVGEITGGVGVWGVLCESSNPVD